MILPSLQEIKTKTIFNYVTDNRILFKRFKNKKMNDLKNKIIVAQFSRIKYKFLIII